MGLVHYVDVDIINLYLEKNGIFNVNIPKNLNNSLFYIQNQINNNNKILFKKSSIHEKIVQIIKQCRYVGMTGLPLTLSKRRGKDF